MAEYAIVIEDAGENLSAYVPTSRDASQQDHG